MALICHTIHSHYVPMEIHIDRRRSDVEEELDNDVELEARREWDLAAESSLSGKRVPKPFPQFVPASSTYSELSRNGDDNDASNLRVAADTAQWYRSMVSQSTVNHPEAKIHPDTKTTHDSEFKQRQTTHVEIDKKSGFSEGAMSEAEMQTASTSSVSTLADMLARNPPPSSGRFQPPVWLAIGPSNKGYAMLEQSGWTEGEGLGRHAYRRKIPKHGRKGSSPLTPPIIYADKQEIHEIKLEDDISELRMVDIVDLTLHSSDEEDQQDTADAPPPPPLERDPYAPKSLLVPLPTILKSDRLGIGLKAKTEGPYKVSRKRITHGQAAVAAHIRASEEAKKRGKGRRYFEKAGKRVEQARKDMLAYLNQ